MSNAVGPVCHIPPKTTAASHGPVSLPNVPAAQPNIPSLTATVNALRQVIMIIAGMQGPPGKNGGGNNATGSWTQDSIQTEKVRVFNPNDNSQYVDIQRVNKLVMKNAQTGQTWTFNRPPSTGD